MHQTIIGPTIGHRSGVSWGASYRVRKRISGPTWRMMRRMGRMSRFSTGCLSDCAIVASAAAVQFIPPPPPPPPFPRPPKVKLLLLHLYPLTPIMVIFITTTIITTTISTTSLTTTGPNIWKCQSKKQRYSNSNRGHTQAMEVWLLLLLLLLLLLATLMCSLLPPTYPLLLRKDADNSFKRVARIKSLGSAGVVVPTMGGVVSFSKVTDERTNTKLKNNM